MSAPRPRFAALRLCLLGATLSLWLGGCFLMHDRPAPPPEPTACDPAPPPRCTASDGPCEPLRAVDAECVGTAWACPQGAEPYVPPWADDLCPPLQATGSPFVDGVHEAPVPIAMDGQCRWLLPTSAHTNPDGAPNHAVADPGRACDGIRLLSGEPAVEVPAAGSWVGIQATMQDSGGRVRALVRGWRLDPLAAFGVRSLGVGLATVEGQRLRVDDDWLFAPELDLGDAAVVFDDHLYAYGCPGAPEWLEEDCIVGRAPLSLIDEGDAWALWGADGWGTGGEPARVFGSGPHRGPVVRDPRGGGLLHIYAIGFGTDLMLTTAQRPEGPWGDARALVPCELPAADPDAYCAGPVVYLHLWDPFTPDTLVVGYSVGTTSEDGERLRAERPGDYWPRIVRVPL